MQSLKNSKQMLTPDSLVVISFISYVCIGFCFCLNQFSNRVPVSNYYDIGLLRGNQELSCTVDVYSIELDKFDLDDPTINLSFDDFDFQQRINTTTKRIPFDSEKGLLIKICSENNFDIFATTIYYLQLDGINKLTLGENRYFAFSKRFTTESTCWYRESEYASILMLSANFSHAVSTQFYFDRSIHMYPKIEINQSIVIYSRYDIELYDQDGFKIQYIYEYYNTSLQIILQIPYGHYIYGLKGSIVVKSIIAIEQIQINCYYISL